MNTPLVALVSLLAITSARAGDAAEFVPLGFSQDGKHFAISYTTPEFEGPDVRNFVVTARFSPPQG